MNIYHKAMLEYDYTTNKAVTWIVKIFCWMMALLILWITFHV